MAKSTTKNQTIEQLQERFVELDRERTRIETNRENAAKRLGELKAEAREKFGTDDVEQLEKQLAKLKLENEQKRSTYQKKLDKIESSLSEIKEQFADREEDFD